MGFDDVDHHTFNYVDDFSLREVELDYGEELMPCVHESFCMVYEPECDTFAFEE